MIPLSRLLAVIVLAAGVLLAPDPADAAFRDKNGDGIEGSGREGGVENASQVLLEQGDPGGPRIVSRGRGDRRPRPALRWDSAGFACVTGMGSFTFTVGGVGGVVPRCAGAPSRPSPLEAAYQAWYWETKLPSPTLATSPPDGAITGLDLYLAIGGPQTLGFNIAALGYTIRLDVTSVYDIDWGDPSPSNDTPLGYAVTKGHRTQGGLYPNGDLRHQYIDRGTVTITVTQRWTAQWSGGGESGTIADRLGTTTTLSLPVQQMVAVALPVGPNPFKP